LRGKLNDYGSGIPGNNIGFDISRSSSAPPNQAQSRFGLGPGFDSQPSNDLRSETDYNSFYMSPSRQEPHLAHSGMYSPGLSWQMWSSAAGRGGGFGGGSEDVKGATESNTRLGGQGMGDFFNFLFFIFSMGPLDVGLSVDTNETGLRCMQTPPLTRVLFIAFINIPTSFL
jgi:hypothetical protein